MHNMRTGNCTHFTKWLDRRRSSRGGLTLVISLLALAFGLVVPASGQLPQFRTNSGALIQKEVIVLERGTLGDNRAHVGDHITVNIVVGNQDGAYRDPLSGYAIPVKVNSSLSLTNIYDITHYPPFPSNEARTNLLFPTGSNVFLTNNCPAIVLLTNLMDKRLDPITGRLVTQPPGATYVTNFSYVVPPIAANTNLLRNDAFAEGCDLNNEAPGEVGLSFRLSFIGQLVILAPRITVTNVCAGVSNGVIQFSGTVSNSGNTLLTNVVVYGVEAGVSTPLFTPRNLAVGEIYRFTNRFETVTAFGTDELGLTVSNSFAAACGALGDFVWVDGNRNGRQDAGELGVPNVSVRLYDCNTNLLDARGTDAAGRYLFTNLPPGGYIVQFINPPGTALTIPNAGGVPDDVDSDANPITGFTGCYSLLPGETNLTVDAGLTNLLGCLGDFVWEDRNGNGIQDTNEPGVAGVLLRLLQGCTGTTELRRTNTGPLGQYLFCDLAPGSYRVEITVPTGYSITLSNQGPNDCVDSDATNRISASVWQTECVTLTAGTNNLCTDIGLKPLGAIGDFVWFDRDGNGLQGGIGETGIANVVVQLLNCSNQVIASTNTDSGGNYLFTCLPASNYVVRFLPPPGYGFTTPNVGANDAIDSDALLSSGATACFPLALGETNRTVDAGLIQRVCLGDFVWEDRNLNGIQDTNEPGVANVLLRLLDCGTGAEVRVTNSGPLGQYLFCDLTPGSYQVEIVVPFGYSITSSNRGPDDCLDSDASIFVSSSVWRTTCTNLTSGTTDLCTDFGLKPMGAIGDYVWEDRNGNGTQDSGEPGVAGVLVQLLNCFGQVITTTNTDGNGLYFFGCLAPSNYVVRFVLPAGYQFTTPNVGFNDAIDSDALPPDGFTACFPLGLGETNRTVDAGLVLRACLGDFVWSDINTNGLQDPGEMGIPNITIRLLTNCNIPVVVATTNTGPTGFYLFCDLLPGNYRVEIVVPTNYTVTRSNVPPNDCVDSDAVLLVGANTWRTECIALPAGTNNLCTDFGLIPPPVCPPFQLLCPPGQIVECGSFGSPTNVAGLTNLFMPPTVVNGPNVVVTIVSTTVNTNVTCPARFSVTRLWQARDPNPECPNILFCSQTITVVDTLPPSITCGDDRIVECNQPFAFTPPFAIDVCDETNVVIRILSTITNGVSPRCPGLTNVIRTWSASDRCGNSNICSQTITIVDTTPPNITCAGNQIIECNQPFAFTTPYAVDGCDGTNVVIRILSTVTTAVSPRCPGLTNIVRTWSASDSCGNSNVCSQTITIIDTTPPTITCADNQVFECNQPFAFSLPYAVDGCDGTNVVIRVLSTVTTPVSPRCPGLTNIVRTWSASDSCGNSNVCSQTITIIDTTPPHITCAPNEIIECNQPFSFTPPYAVDGCDGTNVVIRVLSTVTTAVSPRCPGLTNIVRTWSASDSCGNSNVCSQTITIIDTTPPSITCADNQIIECNQPFAFTPPYAVDGCDGTNVVIRILSTVTTAVSPRCPGLTNIVRTWSASDSCGNSNVCSQTITIIDTTPPSITCADNQIIECNQPFAFTPPYAVDGCDGTNVVIRILSTVTTAVSPRCPGLTNIVRTWSASDSCGNSNVCSQTITIIDTTPPNITCAPNQIIECNQPFGFIPPYAVDACDGTNVVIRILSTVTTAVSPRCPGLTNIVRTWSASDSCGNSNVCSQTITVIDTTPPSITCADNQIIECNQPFAFAPPYAVDGCDGTNVVIRVLSTVTTAVSPRCPGLTNIVRTWSATDSCGNSNVCSQTITIIDTTPPNITCAANQIIECNQPFAFIPPYAVDGCDGTNVVIRILSTVTTAVSPRCPGLTNIVRTWSASDSCGNSNVCSQTITIIDTTPPNITCADNLLVECGQPWGFTPPYAVDGCEGTNVTIRILSTTTNTPNPRCPNLSSYIRTWSASDSCGNSNICSQTITVVDTLPPELICRRDKIVECGLPWSFDPPSAADACEGLLTNFTIVGLDITNRSNPGCTNSFSVTRTWRVSDSCTNTATCSQTVLIVDTTPPTFNCPANRVVECGLPWSFTTPIASDLCGGTNVVVVAGFPTTNMVTCGLAVTRSWTATDRCGNASSCSQTIVIVDTIPPVLTGVPGDLTVRCPSEIPPFGPVTAYDLCDTNPVVTLTRVTNGTCPTIIRSTWTAYDDCSNSVSQTQFITVQPLPPVISTPPADAYACSGSNVSFCVTAINACPLTYQWYFNGNPLLGRTNSCITISNVGPGNLGQYCVVVGNGCYSVTNCAALTPRSAIGDFVWEDSNADGCQDTNELGVSNVVVHLIDCFSTTPIRTTVTDAAGRYRFDCVDPGSYRIRFELPSAAWMFTTPLNPACGTAFDSDPAMNNGMTACFTIGSGAIDLTRDAGLFRKAAIGDFVWRETNAVPNGRQDVGEPGVPGVRVDLMECFGAMLTIRTTNTAADGSYLFTDLVPGRYKVTFYPPAGYQFTSQDVGSDDLDSDANPATGMTTCYTLVSGQTNRTVDAGLFTRLCIDVTEWVACLLPGDQCGPFGKTAQGYSFRSNAYPAFCYAITVSNCGPVTLTNVMVMDSRFGDLTSEFFPNKLTPFPPAGTITKYWKVTVAQDVTNVVSASGTSIADGATAMDNDFVTTYVDPADLDCHSYVYSPDDADGNPADGHVLLPSDGLPHPVTFSFVVCNTGQADLVNVRVTHPALAPYCLTPAPFNLARGLCVTQMCTVFLDCDTVPLAVTYFASASIDTSGGICAYDISGSSIVVSNGSNCGSLLVECEPAGACRVTGGGRQETSYPAVRYVTHGGQVGAPVGNAGFDPGTFEREGSECIHGNWEHVRHDKGGSRGNFHAKIFDSLMCACLGCPENPGSGVLVGELCNPDDRICGPEPRRSPANKICFSGIGDYTMTSGSRTPRAVLFRVDIEDRSEPGNSHAGGSTPPHDRHRIRMWVLTPAELLRLNNPSDRLLDMRRAIACTPGSTALQDGAVGANGLAVPLGTAVFGIRPPDVDDGGEMDHGNHQIHPMIKNCP